jgi:hypothetical protein
VEAILHRLGFDTTRPIDSGVYKYIKNADSLQVFTMVKKQDLRQDTYKLGGHMSGRSPTASFLNFLRPLNRTRKE